MRYAHLMIVDSLTINENYSFVAWGIYISFYPKASCYQHNIYNLKPKYTRWVIKLFIPQTLQTLQFPNIFECFLECVKGQQTSFGFN